MSSSIVQGFTKSLVMNVLSEIGDRTFCAAAILAMRNPRRTVFAGCLLSSVVMTTVSALLGWAAPNLISQKWTHHITTLLFLVFGFRSLWDSFNEEDEGEELEEVEKELETDSKKGKKDGDEDNLKKENQPFLAKFFSPVFLKAFSITLFGEWGDKSQLATIGLAADVDALSVVLGGITGQALCILAAVLGGKSLASKISEKMAAKLCNFKSSFISLSFLLKQPSSGDHALSFLHFLCRWPLPVEFFSSFSGSNLSFRTPNEPLILQIARIGQIITK